MDLLALSRTIWRHKIAAIPVLLVVVLGLFYVLKVKPPTYQSNAEIQLLAPPAAPTQAEIAADPKLAKINSNNPFLGLGDLDFVGDAVVDQVTSHAAQVALAAKGVSPKYQAAMSSDPGNPPIIDITGVGTSGAAAINSAQQVTAAAVSDLQAMQQARRVTSTYMISSQLLLQPKSAQESVSSKLRGLIEVLGVGALLLFVVISVAEAIARRREEDMDLDLELDLPAPPVKARSYRSREDLNGIEPPDSTQEFASPFLSSGVRRPVHSLTEGKSARSAQSAGDVDQIIDEDDD